MKKAFCIVSIGLFSLLFSCTPQAHPEDGQNPQSCCGDDIHIPPIPPNLGGSGG